MKKLLKRLVFMVLLPLLAIEIAVAQWHSLDWYALNWFPGLSQKMCAAPESLIFVGSSQTAAALDAPALSQILFARTGRQIPVFNCGLGFSTAAEQYFALRKLAQSRPGALKGCTVFIEVAAGTCSWRESWKGEWVFPQMPHMIVPYLEVADLPRLWVTSSDSGNDKVFLTLAKVSPFLAQFARIQNKIHSTVCERIDRLLPPDRSLSASGGHADLVADGGVRTDDKGVQLTRTFALTVAADEAKRTRTDWNQSIVADMVSLVRKAGGTVVFFELPVSSIFVLPGDNCRPADFRAACEKWNVPVLKNDLKTTDTDFPDLFHLARSKRGVFTELLADRLLKMTKPEPILNTGSKIDSH